MILNFFIKKKFLSNRIFKINLIFIKCKWGLGDWGLRIGIWDWGLWIGDWELGIGYRQFVLFLLYTK